MSMQEPTPPSFQGEARPSGVDHVRRFGPPALIIAAALVFVFQNTDDTTFDFLWFNFSAPLWVMLVVFMLVGAIAFWGLARRRRSRKNAD